MVVREPEKVDGLGDVREFPGVAGFNEVGVGTEFIGFGDVLLATGRGEDEDDEFAQVGRLANMGEDFKAVGTGEFQVKDDQRRQRVFVAVGEFASAIKIIEGLLAVGGDLWDVGNACLFERILKEESVVWLVFDKKNCVVHERP